MDEEGASAPPGVDSFCAKLGVLIAATKPVAMPPTNFRRVGIPVSGASLPRGCWLCEFMNF